MKRKVALLCGLLSGAAGFNACAVDGVSLALGKAGRGDDVDFARIGLQWNWQEKWFTGGNWFIGGYWEAGIGLWSGDSPAGGNKDVVEVGLTPVFRLQQKTLSAVAPYVEGGIGVHLLSDRRIHAVKDMGSDYHFGSLLGLGARFGSRGRFDLSYRLQHFSNAGIKKPNPGIDFHQIRLQYHF